MVPVAFVLDDSVEGGGWRSAQRHALENRPLRAQRFDFGVGIAVLPHDLTRMLSDQWRRPEDPSRSIGEGNQMAELLDLAELFVFQRDQQSLFTQLGVAEHLARESFVR